ncbi:MAG: cytochrome d ubiquinol oxidase subunit II [Bacteroidaceae bacterium]
MTYECLQQYWWFLVSLLGALLVFLLFVQGANSMIFTLGQTEQERRLIINSTGRKWEFTFTTLVTFGGAFFASFPLFYCTSFGGAYWLWMVILFSFVLQVVSYEFQHKMGNLLGTRAFQCFLVLNGFVGPTLLGGAVATFFNGSNFLVKKDNLVEGIAQPIISGWANASHGLDALLDPWNLVLGVAVFFLARVLGVLYIMNNVDDEPVCRRCRKLLPYAAVPFLLLFVAFLVRTLLKDGYAYDPATGVVFMEPFKYASNLIALWYLPILLLLGVALVLYGIARTLLCQEYVRGIWPVGIGVVLTVLALLLDAGLNNTCFYPSNADLQSSLSIANACSSEFTLRTMAWVSLLIPFVVGYIFYAWRMVDRHGLTREDVADDEAY